MAELADAHDSKSFYVCCDVSILLYLRHLDFYKTNKFECVGNKLVTNSLFNEKGMAFSNPFTLNLVDGIPQRFDLEMRIGIDRDTFCVRMTNDCIDDVIVDTRFFQHCGTGVSCIVRHVVHSNLLQTFLEDLVSKISAIAL